jgi:hypothetical protein
VAFLFALVFSQSAHAANGDYMGLERQLMQRGYSEVEVCSLGLSFCILQYTKGKECLRLQTQGEQIRFMKVDRWSNECRDQGEDDGQILLPADVRYAVVQSSGEVTASILDNARAQIDFFLRSRRSMRETLL